MSWQVEEAVEGEVCFGHGKVMKMAREQGPGGPAAGKPEAPYSQLPQPAPVRRTKRLEIAAAGAALAIGLAGAGVKRALSG